MKQGALQGRFELEAGQSIVRVACLRGSNIVEVEDSDGQRTLCLLPARFNKSLWIRKGGFVVVNKGEHEKALESGSKVTGIICHVLFGKQIRELKKSLTWPAAFEDEIMRPSSDQEKCNISDGSKDGVQVEFQVLPQIADVQLDGRESDGISTEDEGLPPLEANANRRAANCGFYDSSSDEDGNTADEHA